MKKHNYTKSILETSGAYARRPGVELRDDILEAAPCHKWEWNLSKNKYK